MKPKAVFFDLDGTLLNSAPDFVWVINLMLKRRHQPSITLDTIKQQVSDGASVMLKAAFESVVDSVELEELKLEFLQEYSQQLNTKANLYPGVDKLLRYLDDHNILWGVATNKPSKYTLPTLQHFALTERCATVICPEHVNQTKPDPEALYLCASQLSIATEYCWYVGDHKRDITAGNAANMTTVACQYGYLKQTDNSEKWGANYLIDTPSALISLLENTTTENGN